MSPAPCTETFTSAVSGCSSTSPDRVNVSVAGTASASAGRRRGGGERRARAGAAAQRERQGEGESGDERHEGEGTVRYERDTGFLQVGSPLTAPPPRWFRRPANYAELGGELREAALAMRPRLLVRAVREHAQLLGRVDRVVRGVHRRRRADRIHQTHADDAARADARCEQRAVDVAQRRGDVVVALGMQLEVARELGIGRFGRDLGARSMSHRYGMSAMHRRTRPGRECRGGEREPAALAEAVDGDAIGVDQRDARPPSRARAPHR